MDKKYVRNLTAVNPAKQPITGAEIWVKTNLFLIHPFLSDIPFFLQHLTQPAVIPPVDDGIVSYPEGAKIGFFRTESPKGPLVT